MSLAKELRKIAEKMTILYAEDEEWLRDNMSVSLERLFKKVYVAEDGQEALNLYKSNKIDLILTDINMPNMDGITLTAKLRELDAYTFIPILILTTETSEPRKNEAKKAGATGWIEKPFDPDHLLATIKKVM